MIELGRYLCHGACRPVLSRHGYWPKVMVMLREHMWRILSAGEPLNAVDWHDFTMPAEYLMADSIGNPYDS